MPAGYRVFDVNRDVVPGIKPMIDDLQAQIDVMQHDMYGGVLNTAVKRDSCQISDDKWMSLCTGLLRLIEERVGEKIDISADDFLSVLHGGNS